MELDRHHRSRAFSTGPRSTTASSRTRSTSRAPGAATPLSRAALDQGNIHHYLVASQGALPVDSAGKSWSGSYVYNSGNLVLDLLYNLMLESTGRLQKCRIYEMTANKTARSTIAYLIVRDQAHENAYARALETLGVSWASLLPIPKTNAEKFPERQEAGGSRAAEQAVHVRPHGVLRGRADLPGDVAVEGRHRAGRDRAGTRRRPVHDRRRTVRGVLPRARLRPARSHPGDRRPGDGGDCSRRCTDLCRPPDVTP